MFTIMGIYSKKSGFPNIVTQVKFLNSNPVESGVSKPFGYLALHCLLWAPRCAEPASADPHPKPSGKSLN